MVHSERDLIQFQWTTHHVIDGYEWQAEAGTDLLVIDYQPIKIASALTNQCMTQEDAMAIATTFAEELIENRPCQVLCKAPQLLIQVQQESSSI